STCCAQLYPQVGNKLTLGVQVPADRGTQQRNEARNTGSDCLCCEPRSRVVDLPAHYLSASAFSAAASSTRVATPSMAFSSSPSEGKLGARRMFLSSGSFLYGNAEPAPVSAIPASFARAMTRAAVPSTTSRLMK